MGEGGKWPVGENWLLNSKEQKNMPRNSRNTAASLGPVKTLQAVSTFSRPFNPISYRGGDLGGPPLAELAIAPKRIYITI